jgi:hypothetical protein
MIKSEKLDFSLRLISERDLDNLRNWKNSNRASFHYKGMITPAMQQSWYEEYLKRYDCKEDFMFMVEHSEVVAGCLGFRRQEDSWDGYNVIRGVNFPATKGLMSCAFLESINIAWKIVQLPFQVDVLNDNPAIGWYLKCGFKIVTKNELTTLLVKKFDC